MPTTDLEVMKAMFERAAIKFEVDEQPAKIYRAFTKPARTVIEMSGRLGYGGMSSIMAFDEHGSLVDVGAWE